MTETFLSDKCSTDARMLPDMLLSEVVVKEVEACVQERFYLFLQEETV